MLGRIWRRLVRLKWATLALGATLITIAVAGPPWWIAAPATAAAALVYWRYGWKYGGIGAETRAALEARRERDARDRDEGR